MRTDDIEAEIANAIRPPTLQVTVMNWALVCDALEEEGTLTLKCTPDETRGLYLWAKAKRGYRISYRQIAPGVCRVKKQDTV